MTLVEAIASSIKHTIIGDFEKFIEKVSVKTKIDKEVIYKLLIVKKSKSQK